MILNGEEFYIFHNFTTELGNVYETTNGEFIYPNGKPIDNLAFLEALPEQHVERALAWWDRRAKPVVEKDVGVEIPPAARKMTKAEFRAEAQFLLEQADMMEDEEEIPDESAEVAETPEPPEPAGVQAGGQEKDRKLKTTSVKPKKDRGANVLAQMGIAT
jgi:hypothetical protein